MIQYKQYSNDTINDLTIISNQEELNYILLSNHYCVNSIHKLFKNIKVNEILLTNSDINNKFTKTFNTLDSENSSKERDIIIDINNIIYDNTSKFVKKLSIIGSSPELFEQSSLTVDFILLQKVHQQLKFQKQPKLTEYAKKLISLAEQLNNKKFSEITIDDEFINKIINDQLTKEQLLEKNYIQSNALVLLLKNKNQNIEKAEISIEKKIEQINSQKQEDNKNLSENRLKRTKYLTDSLSLVDKYKILFFKLFGINNAQELIFKSLEKKLLLNSSKDYFKQIINNISNSEILLKEKNQTSQERINEMRDMINQISKEKTILMNQIEILQRESELLQEQLILSHESNIDIQLERTISSISPKNDIIFIHMTPEFQPLENSPLAGEATIEERVNAIRLFNPSLSCSTFKLDGSPFENSTFGGGIFGVLLAKGFVQTIQRCDSGTTVDINGQRTGFSKYQDLTSEIKYAENRKNTGNGYNEATVNHCQPYAHIAILDQFFKFESYINTAEDSTGKLITKKKTITKKQIIDIYSQLNSFNNNDINAEKNMPPMPIAFLIDGKILEIISTKPSFFIEKNNNLSKPLTQKEAFEFIEKNFNVINKSINEIVESTENIPVETRKNLAEKFINKFKPKLQEKLRATINNQCQSHKL